jgi:hypothetical protein
VDVETAFNPVEAYRNAKKQFRRREKAPIVKESAARAYFFEIS